jgi:hypothetical protein
MRSRKYNASRKIGYRHNGISMSYQSRKKNMKAKSRKYNNRHMINIIHTLKNRNNMYGKDVQYGGYNIIGRIAKFLNLDINRFGVNRKRFEYFIEEFEDYKVFMDKEIDGVKSEADKIKKLTEKKAAVLTDLLTNTRYLRTLMILKDKYRDSDVLKLKLDSQKSQVGHKEKDLYMKLKLLDAEQNSMKPVFKRFMAHLIKGINRNEDILVEYNKIGNYRNRIDMLKTNYEILASQGSKEKLTKKQKSIVEKYENNKAEYDKITAFTDTILNEINTNTNKYADFQRQSEFYSKQHESMQNKAVQQAMQDWAATISDFYDKLQEAKKSNSSTDIKFNSIKEDTEEAIHLLSSSSAADFKKFSGVFSSLSTDVEMFLESKKNINGTLTGIENELIQLTPASRMTIDVGVLDKGCQTILAGLDHHKKMLKNVVDSIDYSSSAIPGGGGGNIIHSNISGGGIGYNIATEFIKALQDCKKTTTTKTFDDCYTDYLNSFISDARYKYLTNDLSIRNNIITIFDNIVYAFKNKELYCDDTDNIVSNYNKKEADIIDLYKDILRPKTTTNTGILNPKGPMTNFFNGLSTKIKTPLNPTIISDVPRLLQHIYDYIDNYYGVIGYHVKEVNRIIEILNNPTYNIFNDINFALSVLHIQDHIDAFSVIGIKIIGFIDQLEQIFTTNGAGNLISQVPVGILFNDFNALKNEIQINVIDRNISHFTSIYSTDIPNLIYFNNFIYIQYDYLCDYIDSIQGGSSTKSSGQQFQQFQQQMIDFLKTAQKPKLIIPKTKLELQIAKLIKKCYTTIESLTPEPTSISLFKPLLEDVVDLDILILKMRTQERSIFEMNVKKDNEYNISLNWMTGELKKELKNEQLHLQSSAKLEEFNKTYGSKYSGASMAYGATSTSAYVPSTSTGSPGSLSNFVEQWYNTGGNTKFDGFVKVPAFQPIWDSLWRDENNIKNLLDIYNVMNAEHLKIYNTQKEPTKLLSILRDIKDAYGTQIQTTNSNIYNAITYVLGGINKTWADLIPKQDPKNKQNKGAGKGRGHGSGRGGRSGKTIRGGGRGGRY